MPRRHAGGAVLRDRASCHANQEEPRLNRALKWLLCEIFGHKGDHGWLSVWMDSVVTLTDGTTSAGYLMMRVHKGQTEYRHMNAEEELEHMRSGESL